MSSNRRISLFFVVILLLGAALPCTPRAATVETEATHFIKDMYQDNDIQITFGPLPHQAKGDVRVKALSFNRVPDAGGEGVCLVVIEGRSGRDTDVYLPFKVLVKRKLYAARHLIEKGESIHLADLSEKESYLQGAGIVYPASIEDILGKVAKKEIPAGRIVTSQLLDSAVVVQTGEVVTITAENRGLIVQGKGTSLGKGKMGDLVRVKGVSGKEIIGKVTGNKAVAVEF
ncbi:MAG: flagellar basal body P-ring formation chaperone FlgA [Syntrophorhabdales bacterium]|jgi:flagella basal body P-ring formation protein FlgA